MTQELYEALAEVTAAYRTVLEARVGNRPLRPEETPSALLRAEGALAAVERRMFAPDDNPRAGDPDHDPHPYRRYSAGEMSMGG